MSSELTEQLARSLGIAVELPQFGCTVCSRPKPSLYPCYACEAEICSDCIETKTEKFGFYICFHCNSALRPIHVGMKCSRRTRNASKEARLCVAKLVKEAPESDTIFLDMEAIVHDIYACASYSEFDVQVLRYKNHVF